MALPGVRTVLKDRFFTLSRTDIPVGPRVLAIGRRTTADGTNDVADYDPYEAQNEEKVIDSFGDGSELHRAYLELASGGAARIILVALPMGTSDADIQSTTAVTIDGDGVDHNHGSHIVLDAAFDAAEIARPDIIVPWGRGGHPTDWEVPSTPNQLDFGFYADNSTVLANSLVARVSNKCFTISERSHPVVAVMGVRPYTPEYDATPVNISSTPNVTAAQLSTHLALPDLVSRDEALFLTGMYTSVVATEIRPLGYPTDYGYSNGACHYAGQMSQLASYHALTGKILLNVSALRYNPTRVMQEDLIDMGVVPVTLDFKRIPTWVDAQTFANANSDYIRLSTMRIILDTVLVIRQVAQNFVGEAATIETRNALETGISSGLRQMQISGALLASDFTVHYIPRENKAEVDLVLTPAFELRTIEISISVQL